jgi:uncharacterized protein (TIGR02001 family)
MRRSKTVRGGAVVLLSLAAVTLAEDDISVAVTTDFMSKYVWRGQNFTDDWVFQPGASVTYKGLTGGWWANLDLTDENGQQGEFIEHDWYVDYSEQITETIGFWVGGAYYYFPGAGNTTEIYGGLSFDVPLSPAVTVYYDVDAVDGSYTEFSVGHSFEDLGDLPFGIDLGANLGLGDSGYNEACWGVDKTELNDLTLTAGFPFEVRGVTVTPSVAYVVILGSDVSDAAGDDDSIFYGGVGLVFEF